jgi:hypothetical protein
MADLFDSDTRNVPQDVDPSRYGIDPATGEFRHPAAAPYSEGPRPVKGSLDYLEDKHYLSNMTIEGHWPIVLNPGVSHQFFVDWDGRRYMYHYYRTRLNVYDITQPRDMKVVLEKRFTGGEGFGATSIAYNRDIKKWILFQAIEVARATSSAGIFDKYGDPAHLASYMAKPGFRGFRVFELTSPTEWRLIAEVSTSSLHPFGEVQEGSGGVGAPTYYGGKYALVATAPDNTFLRMEYPNYVYSAGQQIYDVEDPTNPKLLDTWWVPGQRLGEEDAYRKWRQYGNRTSWTGARLPIALGKPIEEGGRYGYTAMGGLGFHIIDFADPRNMKTVGNLDLPLSVGGVEGDNVDASLAEERGIVLVNGYPMNEDGYEPYKDVYIIDVKDPTKPAIIGTFPRPKPPQDAPYSDFVLRRGKFGPKRNGYYFQPGKPNPNIAIFPYNNAGVQVFDISDPRNAKIVAYFVPPMKDALNNPQSHKNPLETLVVEWDRKLIWGFTNTGIYLLSTPALGTPDMSGKLG